MAFSENNPGGRLLTVAVLCAVAGSAVAPAFAARRNKPARDDREGYIPIEVYKEMSVFERAAYDKALKLHREGQYRVAADQYRKFAMQFEDSGGMPYAMLMTARCLHKDHKRVTAIKKYTEILDYFPENVSVAVPALYHRARAKFDNGDNLQGYKDYRILVDKAAYVKHHLGIGAKLALSDYYYDNKKQEQAVKYWKDLLKRDIDDRTRKELIVKIRRWYVTNGNFTGYQRFRLGEADLKDPQTYPAQLVVMKEMVGSVDKTNRELAYKAYKFLATKRGVYAGGKCLLDGGAGGKYSRGYYETALAFRGAMPGDEFQRLAREALGAFARLTKGDARYYGVGCGLAELIGGAAGDKLNQEMVKQLGMEKDLAKYVDRACKVAHGAGGRTADVLHKAIVARMGKEPDDEKCLAIAMPLSAEGKLEGSKAFKPMALQILGRIARRPAGKGRDDLYCAYIPAWSGYEQGYKLVVRIGHIKRRFMLHLGMLEHQKKWKDYVPVLDEFEKNTPSTTEGIETKNWIRKRRASVYHHKVRRFADAIKLYYEINTPPGTLWSIQDCYGRLSKWKQQLQVLGEIETSFPPEAPRAAQAIVKVFQRQKMDKEAIAKCRTIMKVHKEHGVSSWAHQELEKYGKASGGGVLDK